MRISDWSSDVCSSDLSCTRGVNVVGPREREGEGGSSVLRSSSRAGRLCMAGGGDVPEHTGRIPQVGDAQSPAFLLGRAWVADPKAFVELERFDVLTPADQVGDAQLHHVVLGPLLQLAVLQHEGRGITPLPTQAPNDLPAQWRYSEA